MQPQILILAVSMLLTALLSGCGPKEEAASKATRNGTGTEPGVQSQDSATLSGGARSVQGLLQGLPKDKQPKPGPEGTIERNEAKGWLAKNVVGKTMEFSLRVEAVEAEPSGEGKYDVELQLLPNADRGEAKKLSGNVIIGSLMLGGTPCQVQVWGPEPLWPDLDTATAKKRRELKGKQITLRARVKEAEFLEGDDEKQLLLMLGLDDVTVLRAQEPQDTDWVTVKEGLVTILFPAKPTRSRKDAGFPNFPNHKKTFYQLKHGDMEFMASIPDEPTPEMIREASKRGDGGAASLKVGQRAVTRNAKILSEHPITFGKYIGLDYTFVAMPEGTTERFQFYVLDWRIVGLAVGSTNPNDVTGTDAEKFFNSLKWDGKSRTEAQR